MYIQHQGQGQGPTSLGEAYRVLDEGVLDGVEQKHIHEMQARAKYKVKKHKSYLYSIRA